MLYYLTILTCAVCTSAVLPNFSLRTAASKISFPFSSSLAETPKSTETPVTVYQNVTNGYWPYLNGLYNTFQLPHLLNGNRRDGFENVTLPGEGQSLEEIFKRWPFDETFTREIMHPIAASAFATNPQLCLTRKINNATMIRKIGARCGPSGMDECSGFAAVSHYHKVIILSFRGTNQLVQFINQRLDAESQRTVPVTGGGNVVKYFYDAYYSVWNSGVKEDFESLKRWYPSYDLWVTGYSLGGSMAAIASHIIVANKEFDVNRMKVMTFGEPRTGDVEFAKNHNRMIPVTYRVIGRDDIIPQLPMMSRGIYLHYNYEVWYDNEMLPGASYKICLATEDQSCSTGKQNTFSMMDHLFYYQRFIFSYGEFGCVA